MTVVTTVQATMADRAEDEFGTRDVGRLFDVHHARLYRLARRLSGSRDDALDLVQETFLRMVRAGDRVPHGPSAEEAWLVRVLVNLARDGRRRFTVRTRHRAALVVSERHDPESAYLARVAVQTALASLGGRRRAVVVLHEMEGESVERIGRLLGIAAVTVRWHLFRARRELARSLGV